jgi:citrate synthase
MQKMKLMIPVLTISLIIFFALPSFGEKISKKRMKESVQETTEMIKKYSVEQRDEAVKNTKSTLDNMDKRIDEMESDLNEKWENMTKSAREQKQKSIRTLKKMRTEVAEWYGGLKHGSANAWDEIKSGFSNAYEALGKALNKAEKSLSKE